MATTTSRVDHGPLPDISPVLVCQRTAKLWLTTHHKDCTAGVGRKPESCSTRRQLMAAAKLHGWPWAEGAVKSNA